MTTNDNGNCTACEMSGITPERAREIAPTYMAAVAIMERRRSARCAEDPSVPWTPDEPATECWTCRQLRAEGLDPVVLARADAPVQRRIGDGGIVRCGDLMGIDDGRRLCGGCSRSVWVTGDDGRFVGTRMANPDGCGDLLERWTLEPGWVDRAVERARREGVL